MAEARCQVGEHHEEQRGCMDFKEAVLYCWHPFPVVNRYHCDRDICLCVCSLDSIAKQQYSQLVNKHKNADFGLNVNI